MPVRYASPLPVALLLALVPWSGWYACGIPKASQRFPKVQVEFAASVPLDTTITLRIDSLSGRMTLPLGIPAVSFPEVVTVRISDRVGERIDAYAVPGDRTIHVALEQAVAWSDEQWALVLKHEVTHIALHLAAGPQPVPIWFSEGLATWASGQLGCVNELRVSAALALHGDDEERVLRLAGPLILGSAPLSYDLYAMAIQYLVTVVDTAGVEDLTARIRRRGFDEALSAVAGMDQETFETGWRAYVRASERDLNEDRVCEVGARLRTDRP